MHSTHFRIRGLAPGGFRHLVGQSDETLASFGARRYVADSKPGYPDRIEMRDAEPGEALILVNYTHQPADNAYRSSHAIFVRDGEARQYEAVDQVPDVMRVRQLSLRAFDAADMMVEASLVDGAKVEELIAGMFGNPQVSYIHAHYAVRGCFACRIDRA